ncbi:MAG: glycosyltransferase family 2 protein [Pirellulales bacterium]
MPRVSIVVPVYNAAPFLVDAMASMVTQTMEDWEMIAVDDGSTDESPAILAWFAKIDPRIRVLRQENQGIVAALNHGCKEARAPWICRMDADDLSHPERLARQSLFAEANPACVAFGGSLVEIDPRSRPLGFRGLPTTHAAIVERLQAGKPGLYHPTTWILKEAFDSVGGYRPEYQWVEDHDLWLRLSQIGELGNLDRTILYYRLHAGSVCANRRTRQSELMAELLGRPRPEKNAVPSHPAHFGGPGKWSRAALRGGHPGVAMQHLRDVFRQHGCTSYALRTAVEFSIRFPSSVFKRLLMGSCTIPSFNEWQDCWSQSRSAPRLRTVEAA